MTAPSLPRRLATFAEAAARHLAAGSPQADPDTQVRRVAICEACPRNEKGVCGECGCFLSVKVAWAGESCPVGRWPAVEGPQAAPDASYAVPPAKTPAAPRRPCCGQ